MDVFFVSTFILIFSQVGAKSYQWEVSELASSTADYHFIYPVTLDPMTEAEIYSVTQSSFDYGNLAKKHISVQDIISSQINGNDKIVKKMATFLPEFASNYGAYNMIQLSVAGFSYPPKFVKIGLSDKIALFHGVNVYPWFDGDDGIQRFVTTVGCNLSGAAKIHVSLPTNVQIKTNLIVQSLSRQSEVVSEGQLSYVMKNPALLRQSVVSSAKSNSEVDIKQQVFYNSSSITLEIDTDSHQSIYKKIYSFISKLESSIGDYLLKQLNDEIVQRNITLVSTCTKFLKTKQPDKKLEPSIDNELFLSNLYVITTFPLQKIPSVSLCIVQSIKSQFDETITLTPGAVVIEGLTNFTNFETTLSNKENQRNNEDSDKTMIVRIRSGVLTGKFIWYYDTKENDINQTLEFIFFVDHLEVEIKIRRYYDYYSEDRRKNDLEVDADLKRVHVKTSLPDIYCEQENNFLRNVLSEYLKSTIVDAIKVSVTSELNNNRPLYVDFFK